LYQDFDKKAGDWGSKKIRVVRYQKRGGKYIPQSKFKSWGQVLKYKKRRLNIYFFIIKEFGRTQGT
jgi:hypothetical protein